MSHIRQEYLDMAYKAVAHVNLQGKVCNHFRFHNAAFKLFFSDISKRPVLVEYLGRALRELPKRHPDVERPMQDCYIIRQLSKYCERDLMSERLRRCGGYCDYSKANLSGFTLAKSEERTEGKAGAAEGDQKAAIISPRDSLPEGGAAR